MMINSIAKVAGLLLAVLLLFVFPNQELYQRQDDISSMLVYKSVTNFVDAARDIGYVTPQMYNDFFDELAITGNTYDIQMEHRQKRYDPVYLDPMDPATFQDDVLLHYEYHGRGEILAILFPDNAKTKDDGSRRYVMNIGDYFAVTVTNTNRTAATVMMDALTGGWSGNPKIVVPYGGLIRNEDH
ncbi:hypothetical protein [Paenibacillus guangzhouensis]|uniref:hypothetical protein n=1 Tax=Paenibacillus guangzhouensis TaxID=1473112 RepID=UPI002AB23444|nr:hypothetical protein [Paenibacillus guangzhouensis]